MTTRALFRKLGEDDQDAFYHLRLKALQSEPRAFGSSADEFQELGPEQTLKLLAEGNRDNIVVGAFLDNALVGLACFSRFVEQKLRHKGRVWGVFVESAHRGAGIGGGLLRELLILVTAKQGVEQVLLGVDSTQTAAKRLYSRLGFQTYGHEFNALKLGQTYVGQDLMMLQIHPVPDS